MDRFIGRPCPSPFVLGVILTLTVTLLDTAHAQMGPNLDQGGSNNGCPPEIDCVNGVCPAGFCECHPGFAGFQCEQQCPTGCDNNGACETTSDGDAFCACARGLRYVTDRGCFDASATEEEIRATETTTAPFVAEADENGFVFIPKGEPMATTPPPRPGATVKDPLATTLRPLSLRTCLPGFVCQHGQCAPASFQCMCDEGWSGAFCHEVCSKNCTDHGRCMIHVDGTSYCSCDQLFMGEFCEYQLPDPTTPAPPAPSPLPTTGNVNHSAPSFANYTDNFFTEDPSCDNCSSNFTFVTPPPLSNNTLRSLEERTCLPGFVCLHGRCSGIPSSSSHSSSSSSSSNPSSNSSSNSSSDSTVITVACDCDPGWVGIFCQTPCTLDCGEFGRCRIVVGAGDEHESCRCVQGYSGPRCRSSSINETVSDFDENPIPTVDWGSVGDLRPLKDRECVVGFVCAHGRCAEGGGIECLCDPGFIGVFCHESCPLDCGTHGVCLADVNHTTTCSCDPKYTGQDCSQLRHFPDLSSGDSDVKWYIAGGAGGLLLVMLFLLVLVPYLMWKKGHVLMLKIVYRFKAFEDDDKKAYDAFISYSNVEDEFVMNQLFPKLTEMKFKVCVHTKDFLPGETIANNIIEAVDNSRRTILVLTPAFLQSEFCRFEYQQAHHQMIRQKQRIIPVVLQDVAREKKAMDPTLRSILETITYLDYPGEGEDPKRIEKFWKRLELSMPKRKECSQTVLNDPSAYRRLTSTSSVYSTISEADMIVNNNNNNNNSLSPQSSSPTTSDSFSSSSSTKGNTTTHTRSAAPGVNGRVGGRGGRGGGGGGEGGRSSRGSCSRSNPRSNNNSRPRSKLAGGEIGTDAVTIEMERSNRYNNPERTSNEGRGGGGRGYTNDYVNAGFLSSSNNNGYRR